jgi:hypothetical protein
MLPNFIKKRSVSFPLCQDKIQEAKEWLSNQHYTSPDQYFIEKVETLLKAPSPEITLSQIVDKIYHYTIDCAQDKTCEMDPVMNLTRTRFAQLEAFAQEDCTRKMLSDRLADITGRLFILTWNAAAENLGKKKHKGQTARMQSLPRLAATPSTTTTSATSSAAQQISEVNSSAISPFITEHASLTVSQDSWSLNQTNGSDWAEEVPRFNLTQWKTTNTTENTNLTPIAGYPMDYPNYPAYVGASVHGLVSGTLAGFTERLGDCCAERYPAQRTALIGLAKGLYLMGVASFPLLYASLESAFLQLDASQTKESLQNSLFTFLSSVLLQLIIEKAQQNGLGQSQIRRLVGHLIPLLACGWVLRSADKPVSALIAWALNMGTHMLSYYAWTQCLPARSSECAVSHPQESEAPPFQTMATEEMGLPPIGTFHERSLQHSQQRTARVLPQLVLPLEVKEETPFPETESIYSEINEVTANGFSAGKESMRTQPFLLAPSALGRAQTKKEISEAGYMEMHAPQKSNPIPFPLSSSLLYSVPQKQPKPVLASTDEQGEKIAYICKM